MSSAGGERGALWERWCPWRGAWACSTAVGAEYFYSLCSTEKLTFSMSHSLHFYPNPSVTRMGFCKSGEESKDGEISCFLLHHSPVSSHRKSFPQLGGPVQVVSARQACSSQRCPAHCHPENPAGCTSLRYRCWTAQERKTPPTPHFYPPETSPPQGIQQLELSLFYTAIRAIPFLYIVIFLSIPQTLHMINGERESAERWELSRLAWRSYEWIWGGWNDCF